MAGSENTQQIKDDFFQPKRANIRLFGLLPNGEPNDSNIFQGYSQYNYSVVTSGGRNILKSVNKPKTTMSGTSILSPITGDQSSYASEFT